MSTLSMIDTTQSFTLTAYTGEKIAYPTMVALADKMSMPELLNADVPTKQAEPLIISETGDFIAWLQSSTWASRIENELQCMAEDLAGRPFLTSWLNSVEFTQFVAEAQGSPFGSCLQKSHDTWIALGMDSVLFDGYKLVA